MPPIKKADVIQDKEIVKAFSDIEIAVKSLLDEMVLLTSQARTMNSSLLDGNVSKLTKANADFNKSLKEQSRAEQEIIKLEKLRVELSEKYQRVVQQQLKVEQEQEKITKLKNDSYQAEIKATNELTKAEILKSNALKAEQQAQAAVIKNQKEALREAEKATKAAANETSAYARKNKELNNARKLAKDVGVEYGRTSKQFQNAAEKVRKLDKELKDIDNDLGQNNRSVGKYENALNGLKGGFVAITAGIAAASGVFKAFNFVIASSQTTADAFEESMQGIQSAVQYTATAMANGNFKDFFGGLERAYKAGKEYAAALDEAGDRQRALSATTADATIKFAEYKKIYQDVTKSKKERIKAIDDEISLEKELAINKKDLTAKAYKDELKYVFASESGLGKLTDARQAEFEYFLKNRQIQGESVDKAKQILALEEQLTATKVEQINVAGNVATITVADARARERARESIDRMIASMGGLDSEQTKQVLKWKQLLETYTINDARLDSLTAKYVDLQNSTADITSAEADMTKKRSGMIKALDAENEKTDKATEAKQKEIKSVHDLTDAYEDFQTMQSKGSQVQIGTTDERSQRRYAEAKKLGVDLEKLESDAMAKTKANQEKELEDAKSIAEQKKEIEQGLYDASVNLGQTLFDRRIANLEAEKSAIDSKYAKILDNENLTEEQRSALEAKRDAEKQALTDKQNKAARKQAIFNKSLALLEIFNNTRAAIMAAWKLPPPVNAIQAGLVAATGAINAAAVVAQPIPQYKKGTKNAKGGLSEVAEAGAELIIDKKYGAWIAEKRQYADITKGSTVLTAAETARVMDGVRRSDIMSKSNALISETPMLQKLLASNQKIENAITRQKQAKVYIASGINARVSANQSNMINRLRG